jgi:hypothetical protein
MEILSIEKLEIEENLRRELLKRAHPAFPPYPPLFVCKFHFEN